MTQESKQTALRWLPAAAFSMLIAMLSLSPTPCEAPSSIPQLDKVVHVGMYAILMLLMLRAGGRAHHSPLHRIMLLVLCVGYGVLMEVGQLLLTTAGRTFSVADIVANMAGATTAGVLLPMYGESFRFRKRATGTENMETE